MVHISLFKLQVLLNIPIKAEKPVDYHEDTEDTEKDSSQQPIV